MRKYVIERAIPGVGKYDRRQLSEATEASNEVLASLAPDVQWVHSYVTDDATYCIYLARDEEVIRRHAKLSGFPATKIKEVRGMFSPCFASEQAAGAAGGER